ncbi:MAG: bifunctional folylpolyglutamate synthase/dihydrofolate synthase [Acidobacteria bacterium]|nr:MAG: bifunctional folylpolyglutamate synthase/dihydrofolate synthase [Acidobacteriota bacterium]
MNRLDSLFRLEKLGIKFGLDNIRTLCAALGSPETAFQSILIAGTNGKGSVTAMVEHALRSAGVRAARYTSPHLVRLEERFFIDGAPVEADAMQDVAEHVQRVVADLIERRQLEGQPTFFEVTTAMAFELFRRHQVEVAVLEVGLGGRLDSTNVVTPVATAITSIDLDHQALLGSTIAQIAFEKAGIIKPGTPVVLGETKPEAVDVITRVCDERGARLIHTAAGVEMRTVLLEDGRTTLELTTPVRRYPRMTVRLRGRHQVANAVTAVRLLETLPWNVPEAAIVAGISDVIWPGRLELIQVAPGRAVLLDSAHNPAGASALAEFLAETQPDPLPIVFGVMRDKDAAGMLTALAPHASAFVITAPRMARASSVADLASLATLAVQGVPVLTAPDPAAALTQAWELGPLICAAGSIFLIGEILDLVARTAR